MICTLMTRTLLLSAGLIGLLAACAPHQPLPYSPHYSPVTLTGSAAGKAGVVSKGYDTRGPRAQTVLVPDACVTPDTAEQPVYLPPGCANSLNLQLMVERERDLMRGRRPGPAPAGPSVRAAQRYIHGSKDERDRTQQPDAGMSTTQPVSSSSSVQAR